MATENPLRPVLPVFRAVVRATVPGAVSLDEEALRRGEETVAWALSPRPPKVVRQVTLFLRVLNALSWLRYGRSFTRVTTDNALGLLALLEHAPILLLRRGVWGVRTLAFMAVYSQPEVARELGYGADSLGWTAHEQAGGAWPEREGAAQAEPEVAAMLGRAAAAGRTANTPEAEE